MSVISMLSTFYGSKLHLIALQPRTQHCGAGITYCRGAAASRTCFEAHVAYETLHPFTDGNGRSGRALWAKHMLADGQDGYWLERGFLHTFYYQSLENTR